MVMGEGVSWAWVGDTAVVKPSNNKNKMVKRFMVFLLDVNIGFLAVGRWPLVAGRWLLAASR